MQRYPVLFLVLGVLVGGCGLFNRLQVKSLAQSADPPGNVAVYLSVADGDHPVTGLTAKDFQIFENGQPIDPDQSGETLLDRDVASVHHTLLLVDMSNPANHDALARAASGFVASVRQTQAVTVYAFDGSPEIHLAGEYPRGGAGDDATSPDAVAGLASYTSHDPSRDLRGAITQALDQLDVRLMQVKKPVRVGTLVVFTEGPDLAGRVTADKLDDVLDKTPYQILAVGIGEDKGDFSLKSIGRNGVVRAPNADALGPTLSNAGMQVSRNYDSYYLVAYCSPARAGTRALRVDVHTTDKEGNELKGSVEGEFDATGFGPGCNPKATPRFAVKAGSTSPAPEPDKPATAPRKPTGKREPAKQPPDEGKKPAGDDTNPGGIVPPPAKPGYAPTPP